MSLVEEVNVAKAQRKPIRIERDEIEDGHETGFVVGVNSAVILLQIVTDEIHLNGYQAIRTADVTEVEAPDPHAAFIEQALELRGEILDLDPGIDITSIPSIVSSAGSKFPLITIHRELADPDVCHIGKLVSHDAGTVSLLEVSPDAEWDDEPTSYSVFEITRVDFGGSYEEALAAVANAR